MSIVNVLVLVLVLVMVCFVVVLVVMVIIVKCNYIVDQVGGRGWVFEYFSHSKLK